MVSFGRFLFFSLTITAMLIGSAAIIMMIADGGISFTTTPEHSANGGILIFLAVGIMIAHIAIYFLIKPRQ